MDSTLSAPFCMLLTAFQPVFTAPSYANFVTLVVGWVLCVGRRTTTRVLQASGAAAGGKHFSAFYRFFSRATWVSDEVGRALVELALPWVPGTRVVAPLDDTLCRKSGPQLWGAAMHFDPLLSCYGKGRQRRSVLSFGHNWVVLSVWAPLPWAPDRGVALPVLWRLYRPARACPPGEFRTRTQLAAELVAMLAGWLPAGRRLVVVGDSDYACRTLVRGLPPTVDFVGAMNMKADCYDPPPPGSRRNRKKGPAAPSPRELAADPGVPWQSCDLMLYGRRVRLRVKARWCLWYRVAGTRPVLLVVTRDPGGRIEDRAYFSTQPEAEPAGALADFARRWPQEVMFHDVKQHLGLEDPQSGWWRRPAGHSRPPQQAGPAPHPWRGRRAAERTAPLAFLSYALVTLWYFQHGAVAADVQRARSWAPWYRHKRTPSFVDMLQAARRELLAATRGMLAADELPPWLLTA